MNPSLSYKNWFEHLQVLTPQEGIVYVGAGTGLSLLSYINDSVKSVILIEAEKSYFTRLEQLVNLHDNWTFLYAIVGSKAENSTFYHLSNIAESSLVAPEYLNNIWRNLKILEERTVAISPLDEVLDKAVLDSKNFNWLVIDCLPALPILQGAGQYNSSWEVISARVIVDESICAEQGATKREVDNYLSLLGYRCVSVEEERQPAIAKALYVRDWRYLEKQIAEQAKAVSELQGQNTQLSQQLTQAKAEQEKQIAEQAKAVSDLRDQNTQLSQQLTQAKAEQEKQIAEQAKAVSDLRDQNTQLSQQLIQAKAEQEKQIAEQAKAMSDLQGQNTQLSQQLTQAKAEQEKQSAEQAKAVSNLQTQKERLNEERDEAKKRVRLLEIQNVDLTTRQTLLQDEIIRAEAQIDLIKDVLLREPGL